MNKIGETFTDYPIRIWTIFNFWTNMAYIEANHSKIDEFAIDETSTKNENSYVAIDVDLSKNNIFHAK